MKDEIRAILIEELETCVEGLDTSFDNPSPPADETEWRQRLNEHDYWTERVRRVNRALYHLEQMKEPEPCNAL